MIIALYGQKSLRQTISMRILCSLSITVLSLVSELLVVYSSVKEQGWSRSIAGTNLSIQYISLELIGVPIQILGSYLQTRLNTQDYLLITGSLYLPLFIYSIVYLAKYLKNVPHKQSYSQHSNRIVNNSHQQASSYSSILIPRQRTCKQKFNLIFCTYLCNSYFFLTLLFLFLTRLTPGTSDMVTYYITVYKNYSLKDYGYVSSTYFAGTAGCAIFYLISTVRKCKWRKYQSSKVFLFSVLLKFLVKSTQISIQFIGGNKLITYGVVSFLRAVSGQFQTLILLEWAINFCPKNFESTFYSLMIFSFDLGDQCAREIQANVFENYYDTERFSNMWLFMMISAVSVFLPLFVYCFKTPQQLFREARDHLQEIKRKEHGNYMRFDRVDNRVIQ